MNLDKWEESCRLYERNLAGLKFKAIGKIENGKLKLSVTDVDEKYQPSIKKLMVSNAKGLLEVMASLFRPGYAAGMPDEEEEIKKCTDVMKNRTEEYVNVLFTKGVDAVMELIGQQTTVLHTTYILEHIVCKNGVWTLPDGTVWTGDNWKTPEGKEYSDAFGLFWDNMINKVA